jgi:two-component system, chemotaxis family, sensor kinase CheA
VTIVDVLSFLSGDQVFVAPIAIVDEIVEVQPDLTVDLPVADFKGVQPKLIQYRGKTIPLFSLDALLNHKKTAELPRKALVVSGNRGVIAFGVDRMLGQQEAVVRSLDDALVRVPGMAGATDLGDGRPTLVLDLAILGGTVMQNSALMV